MLQVHGKHQRRPVMRHYTEPEEQQLPSLDYTVPHPHEDRPPEAVERARREWGLVAAGLAGLLALMAVVVALVSFGQGGDEQTTTVTQATPAPAAAAVPAAAPTLAQSKGVAFESFHRVDPTLPAPVTNVNVDVFQHVTQVSKDLAPT